MMEDGGMKAKNALIGRVTTKPTELRIMGKSRRAAAGRAELRALTFWEARYGAFSAKMQTAGTLPVPSGYPVHFAGA